MWTTQSNDLNCLPFDWSYREDQLPYRSCDLRAGSRKHWTTESPGQESVQRIFERLLLPSSSAGYLKASWWHLGVHSVRDPTPTVKRNRITIKPNDLLLAMGLRSLVLRPFHLIIIIQHKSHTQSQSLNAIKTSLFFCTRPLNPVNTSIAFGSLTTFTFRFQLTQKIYFM